MPKQNITVTRYVSDENGRATLESLTLTDEQQAILDTFKGSLRRQFDEWSHTVEQDLYRAGLPAGAISEAVGVTMSHILTEDGWI